MFKISLKVSHKSSGTELVVNEANLPTIAPLLHLVEHLRRHQDSTIPPIPSIFYELEAGYTEDEPSGPGVPVVIVLPPHGPAPLEDGCEGSLPRPAPPPLVAFHATNDSVDSPPIEMHEVKVPEGKVICEVCHEPQSKTNIQRHKRIHHAADSADPKPYKCDPPCKYSTNRKDLLVKHQVDTNGRCGR